MAIATGNVAHSVYIALGSNMGDRHQNLLDAYRLIRLRNIGKVERASGLYETNPKYVEAQPKFLNAALKLETFLPPTDLLDAVKDIELDLGRKETNRWGPRIVDIDILFYGTMKLNGIAPSGRRLELPHPRIQEREFVLRPLLDLSNNLIHPVLNLTIAELLQVLKSQSSSRDEDVVRVLPLGNSRNGNSMFWNMQDDTRVMGILNVTPDSFSDGNMYSQTIDTAVKRAYSLEEDGADIIDIGGESTRPGADDIGEALEIERVIPVIAALRKTGFCLPISIDTRRSRVAKEAVLAGADMVNDVSGGSYDSAMFDTVAQLGVPYVGMHMRGTPQTMTKMTEYSNLINDVTESLKSISNEAEKAGVPRWLHVLDPGLGFAKTVHQNINLLANLPTIAKEVQCPLLIGPSRKGFIGVIGGGKKGSITRAEDRDWGTIGAVCAGAEREAKIIRVHNVKGVKEALRLVDAIKKIKI